MHRFVTLKCEAALWRGVAGYGRPWFVEREHTQFLRAGEGW
jgi:hypothetical protein